MTRWGQPPPSRPPSSLLFRGAAVSNCKLFQLLRDATCHLLFPGGYAAARSLLSGLWCVTACREEAVRGPCAAALRPAGLAPPHRLSLSCSASLGYHVSPSSLLTTLPRPHLSVLCPLEPSALFPPPSLPALSSATLLPLLPRGMKERLPSPARCAQ